MDARDAVLIAVLSVSLVTDMKYRKIFNSVTFSGAAAGLVLNLAFSGWHGIEMSAFGMLAGMAVFFIPFAAGGLGAGDVKLLGAVGAIKGPVFALYAGLFSAVAGGVMAASALAWRGLLPDFFKNLAWALCAKNAAFLKLKSGGKERIAIPYGVAIFAGTVFALTAGWGV